MLGGEMATEQLKDGMDGIGNASRQPVGWLAE